MNDSKNRSIAVKAIIRLAEENDASQMLLIYAPMLKRRDFPI
ncbi:hypothetical protein [Nostoc sp. CCY 9925]